MTVTYAPRDTNKLIDTLGQFLFSDFTTATTLYPVCVYDNDAIPLHFQHFCTRHHESL